MRLNNNIASLNVYREYAKVLQDGSAALQRISSGVKLSKSKDNPNGIAASEKLNMQIRGLQMSNRNLQDGVSMLQTAEGGMNEITSMLQRIKELTVQSGSGANSALEKESIQKEIGHLVDGIDNMAEFTNFNGVAMLRDPSEKGVLMAIGANEGESVNIPTYNFSKSTLGLDTKKLTDIDITKSPESDMAMDIVNAALDTVISARSKYGALENRFESGMQESDEITDKLSTADSYIKDADIGEEIMKYTTASILSQAGNAMMVQTNKMPQEVLSILQNIK